MTFQPGQVSNPNGRKPGSRNRRTQEILDLIQGRGDKDPLDALSEIISTSDNPDHRISASNILAPYLHSKCATKPTPRFVPEQIEVPTFNTVREAEAYLAHIPVLLGKGEIDSQTALELSQPTKNWLDAIYARQDYDLNSRPKAEVNSRPSASKAACLSSPAPTSSGLAAKSLSRK